MPTIQIDEGHALTAEEAERRVRARFEAAIRDGLRGVDA